VSRAPSLDSFGEIYPGFLAHRLRLKLAFREEVDYVWNRSFHLVRQTEAFYQRSDADVARETMRILLLAQTGRKSRRWVRKK
jgi:hypothetical protein